MSSAPVTPCRLLVVDEQPLIRLGLRRLLDDEPGFAIVAEADTAVDALRVLEQGAVDLVVLDIALSGRGGIECLARIRAHRPAPPVLVYSRFPPVHYALRTRRAGASGYVHKSAATSELLAALRLLAAGGTALPDAGPPTRGTSRRLPGGAPHEQLSNREFEVLRLLVDGRSVSAIAHELSLSIKTVSTHRTRLLGKLGLASTADLVHYAIAHDLDDSRP